MAYASTFLNIVALIIATYASLFFWTRGWIEFSFSSLPWIIYTIFPYCLFELLILNYAGRVHTTARKLLYFITAIGLVMTTGFSYIKFIDESLIFYLRQFLFLVPVLMLIGMALLLGVGTPLTRAKNSLEI